MHFWEKADFTQCCDPQSQNQRHRPLFPNAHKTQRWCNNFHHIYHRFLNLITNTRCHLSYNSFSVAEMTFFEVVHRWCFSPCDGVKFWIFWPRSLRFGGRYSQKCSLFLQKQINALVYLCPVGLWLWKWGEPVSRIYAPICFSRIFLPVSWQIFHSQHADINGEHLSYLNKTNWPFGGFLHSRLKFKREPRHGSFGHK